MGSGDKDAFCLLHDRAHRDAGGARAATTARREQSRAERIEVAARKVVAIGRRAGNPCQRSSGMGACMADFGGKRDYDRWCAGCQMSHYLNDLAAALSED